MGRATYGARMDTDAKEEIFRAYRRGDVCRDCAVTLLGRDQLEAVEEYLTHSREPDDVRLYD